MNEFPEESEDSLDDLRMENEIKKIKLSLEHGANFLNAAGNELPPEIESKWLDYMQQFEDQLSKRKKITIYELAGKPNYIKVDEISDEKIEIELKNILKTLTKSAVIVDTICEVDDRELYRFITEELFLEETNDIQIDGLLHCFTYEEYHPNHKYDITNICTEFIDMILKKELEWIPGSFNLCEEIYTQSETISKEKAITKLEYFRDAFLSFSLEALEISSILINEENTKAELNYTIEYSGITEANEMMQFMGKGSFILKNDDDCWMISVISLPGFVM